jgi:hypothetical protein
MADQVDLDEVKAKARKSRKFGIIAAGMFGLGLLLILANFPDAEFGLFLAVIPFLCSSVFGLKAVFIGTAARRYSGPASAESRPAEVLAGTPARRRSLVSAECRRVRETAGVGVLAGYCAIIGAALFLLAFLLCCLCFITSTGHHD